MLATLPDLSGGLSGFDEIIDVRSPAEFAEDHVPGAVNLPVLSDAERAEVGTIYTRRSKFEARRIGAALIARSVAAHLDGPLADRGGGWKPLVYCWRGGQRSHAMALILSQVGWRTTVLAGGYRTYRRGVVARLYEGEPAFRAVLLGGPTGVGKTDMLARLAARGMQTLDLEALANHRGSLLGDLGEQPSQKLFESRLALALDGIDPSRPVVIEAESSRIGERFLPPVLWAAMQAAPRIDLEAPLEVRVQRLLSDYAPLAADPERFCALLERLPGRHGRARLAAWCELARAGDLAALAEALIAEHYDPAYARSRREAQAPLARVMLADIGQGELDAAADRLVSVLPRFAGEDIRPTFPAP